MWWPIGPRVEDPVRLKEFSDDLGVLRWDDSSRRKSLIEVFDQLSRLAHAELRYYYKRRKAASRRAAAHLRAAAADGRRGGGAAHAREIPGGADGLPLLSGYDHDLRHDDARLLRVVRRRAALLHRRLALLPHPLLHAQLPRQPAQLPELPRHARGRAGLVLSAAAATTQWRRQPPPSPLFSDTIL